MLYRGESNLFGSSPLFTEEELVIIPEPGNISDLISNKRRTWSVSPDTRIINIDFYSYSLKA